MWRGGAAGTGPLPHDAREVRAITEPTMTRLTARYDRAVTMARTLHAIDVRKGTNTPYLAHVLSASALVLEHEGSEEQAIAALLHDAVEDHGGLPRLAQIRAEFGDGVAAIVEACSDSTVEDRNDKLPWWDRKVAYLEHLEGSPAEAVLVTAADKLHNARAVLVDYLTIGEELWSKFNGDAGRAGTMWYQRRVAEILGRRLRTSAARAARPMGSAQELQRTVDQLFDAVRAVATAEVVDAEQRDARRPEPSATALIGKASRALLSRGRRRLPPCRRAHRIRPMTMALVCDPNALSIRTSSPEISARSSCFAPSISADSRSPIATDSCRTAAMSRDRSSPIATMSCRVATMSCDRSCRTAAMSRDSCRTAAMSRDSNSVWASRSRLVATSAQPTGGRYSMISSAPSRP